MDLSRLSSGSMIDQNLFHLKNNQTLLFQLQQKISSGKNILTASDDPVGMTYLLQAKLQESRNEQYGKNIDYGISEIEVADTAINGILNIVQRARELAVQGANGTNSDAQNEAIAKEVDGLIGQALQMGNSTFQGRYIFSGFETDTAPFTKTGDDIAYGGSAAGADDRQIQIGPDAFVTLNVNGEDLLGNVTVAGSSITGAGLFYHLTQLREALEANDNTTVRSVIASLDIDLSDVTTEQAALAGVINQLQLTRNRLADQNILNAKEISRIQDIDMAKAISDLNFQQTIYQASLAAMSKILQTSLVNFLG